MNRVFLSHSSTDKIFVRKVAEILGDAAIIDERDFAAGARTIDEIVEKINDATIFVAFLSQEALASEWVQKELDLAIEYSKSKDVEILIFSLDKNVVYTDKRIPESLRKHYNIKYIKTAETAVSRIRDTDRMLNLKNSPALREAETIFLGRTDQIRQFESDFSNIEGTVPTFIVAYNYYVGIGRRHFLKHVLNKIAILKHTQTPITVTLHKGESIENLIIKLNSVVFSDEATHADLHELSLDAKIEILLNLVKEYKRNNRIIFIIDEGGIVLPNHQIVEWFDRVAQNPELHNRLTFCLISNWEPNYQYINKANPGVSYHIDELDRIDTQNLFLNLLNIYGQNHLSTSIKSKFISKLTGIPAQIRFAVQQIKVSGPTNTILKFDDITTHSDSYSAALIEAIKSNELAYELCLILADGGISLDVVYDVFGETENVKKALTFLSDYSALEYIHGAITSVRLNATISDFIKRRNLPRTSKYKEALKKAIDSYVLKSLDSLALEDYSKFILVLEDFVRNGKEIPSKYYIAPLLIDNIIKDYNAGNYQAVETYCRNLLRQTNFDPQVMWEIHYHLVRVYARTGRNEFWQALQESPLDYIDREFLKGFYYRNKRSPDEIKKALTHFKNVLDQSPSHRRTKREIVNTYLLLDDYEKALEYAKDNYKENQSDILHLQSYFIALIRNKKFNANTDERAIKELMECAKANPDPRSQDVYKCMLGEYEYWVNKDLNRAIDILDEATKTNENIRYPLKAMLIIFRKEGEFDKADLIKRKLSEL